MTFLDLYGDELDRLLGSTSRTLFTLPRRKAAINRGQTWFAEQTGVLRKEASIAIADGVSVYALSSLTDYVRLDGTPSIGITTGSSTSYFGGHEFVETDIDTLDRTEPGWRNRSGRPEKWYRERVNGVTRVGIVPTPDVGSSETWALRWPYVAKPADMVADADEPFTVDAVALDDVVPYHDAIALYAAHLLEPLRKDRVAAEEWLQQALRRVAEFVGMDAPTTGQSVHVARNYRVSSTGDFNNRIRIAGYP